MFYIFHDINGTSEPLSKNPSMKCLICIISNMVLNHFVILSERIKHNKTNKKPKTPGNFSDYCSIEHSETEE